MEEKIILNEMIDMLGEKSRRKRVKYDLIPEDSRSDAYFKHNGGKWLDWSLVRCEVTKWSAWEICKALKQEGAEKRCFWIDCYSSGVGNLEEVMKEEFFIGMGVTIYCGNGVGYFQGEQSYGPPERFILVNKKKQGHFNLFGN